MSDKWVTNSSGSKGSDSIVSQISQLPNAVKRFTNWVFCDWAQDLFDYINKEIPVTCAYSFTKEGTRRYYVIIQNPTSENILRVIEACCDFEEQLIEKDRTFFCEFLAFGTEEEKYLGIPETARKITHPAEEDYAGNTRTLGTVQA